MMIGLGDPLLALQHPGRSWVLEGRGIEGFEWETGPGPTSFLAESDKADKGKQRVAPVTDLGSSNAFSSDLCSLSPGHKLKIISIRVNSCRLKV